MSICHHNFVGKTCYAVKLDSITFTVCDNKHLSAVLLEVDKIMETQSRTENGRQCTDSAAKKPVNVRLGSKLSSDLETTAQQLFPR